MDVGGDDAVVLLQAVCFSGAVFVVGGYLEGPGTLFDYRTPGVPAKKSSESRAAHDTTLEGMRCNL